MGTQSANFQQVLAAELRELEGRLTAAHLATFPNVQELGSHGQFASSWSDTKPASLVTTNKLEPTDQLWELQQFETRYVDTHDAEVRPPPPSFHGTPRLSDPDGVDCVSWAVNEEPPPAPVFALGFTRAASGAFHFPRTLSVPASGVKAYVEMEGGKDQQESVCMRWWNIAAGMMSIRDQFSLREHWDELERRRFPTDPYTTELSDQTGRMDIVQETWIMMSGTQHRKPRLSSRGSKPLGSKPLATHLRPSSWDVHRFVLHPFSWKRISWVTVGFAFMACDIFWLTMDQFEVLGKYTKNAIEVFAGIYWTLDVCLSFMTGKFVNVQLELRPWMISKHYVTTWFAFDVALVVLQWITLVEVDMDASSASAGIIKYMLIARYFRLLRFVKSDQLLTSILETINSVAVMHMVRVLQYLVSILLWVHVTGCAFYAIGVSSEDGWAQQRTEVLSWPVNYLTSIHWAACNLQGPTDIGPGFLAGERAFAVCHVLVSVIVLALFVSKLTNVMATMEEIAAKSNRQAEAAQLYCKQHCISAQLSVRVRKWVELHQVLSAKRQLSREEEEFMQLLPTDLRHALLEESRSPLVAQHEVFHACRECNTLFFQKLICEAFTPTTHLPGDTIFSFGEVCTRMFIVTAGDGSYLKYGAVLRAFMQSRALRRGHSGSSDVQDQYKRTRSTCPREGTSLCEAVLWIHWMHAGDFASLTHMSLLLLEAHRFEHLVTSYPSVQIALQSHAQHFIGGIRRATDPSDLFNTKLALQLL